MWYLGYKGSFYELRCVDYRRQASGLTAGALLAKRGLRVGVIDKNYNPGGRAGFLGETQRLTSERRCSMALARRVLTLIVLSLTALRAD